MEPRSDTVDAMPRKIPINFETERQGFGFCAHDSLS
jgi:hypothetical protein